MADGFVCGSQTRLFIGKNGNRARGVIVPLLCGRTAGPDSCLRCVAKRAARVQSQVEEEQAHGVRLFYAHVKPEEVGRLLRHFKNAGARYYRFPQEDGAYLISDVNRELGGAVVPQDAGQLAPLLKRITGTPKGSRMSHSAGFGGKFTNLRGKPSDDEWEQYQVAATAAKVADVYAATGARVKSGGGSGFYVDMTVAQELSARFEFEDTHGLRALGP